MTTSDAVPSQPRRPADRVPSGVRGSRAPGRPRDPRCDEAILDAALHELATAGFTRLSMEAVAAGAGVGKATVYRRWPTKDALIVDALDTLADEVEAVETGSLRDDLVAWLNDLRRRNMQSLSGRIMPKLAAERTAHPELFATYSDRVLEPSRRWAADLLRRGVASGELAADVDVELVVDMLVGPVTYRQYMSGDHEVSGTRIARIVDVVLSGIRSHHGPPAVPVDAGVPAAAAIATPDVPMPAAASPPVP
ncbi:TetR/AcrR family transcriptional regulator, partial [Frankia sp. AgKG'84/4]|uniref:TetR/AcrR family transcriptional regulator n=1 Tax=Frankia sp. AgKG'84/4 TaxID=573490 RepID=UPI002029F5A3